MKLFRIVAELLEQREDLALASVLFRSGSAPCAEGARMVVRADGSIRGTIGGGALEAGVLRSALKLFDTRGALIKEFTLADSGMDGSGTGMTCGGRVEVLLQFLDSSITGLAAFYGEVAATTASNRKAWLVTALPEAGRSDLPPHQWLLRKDGSVAAPGKGELHPREELFNALLRGKKGRLEVLDTAYHVDVLCNSGTVFIFGAGHVGQALARITAMLDFRTIVVDDREEFARKAEISGADEILVPGSFERAFEGLPIAEHSYVVIVTRGHIHDGAVLAQALATNAGYIGMIGSRRKRDAIYDALAASHGFGPKDFSRVHSPVGLSIGAVTPEEIAVSIAAEMIQARAGKKE